MEEVKLYEEGLKAYPKIGIVVGNILMIFWIALGFVGCYLLFPILGYLYIGYALLMVYVVLRKLVCTNCYYYDRWCGIGWGKLSALMFKKGEIKGFGKGAIKVAPAIYGLLTFIPIITILVSFFIHSEYIWLKIFILLFMIAFSLYSSTIGRKKNCTLCKMRLICPGSAIK